MRPPRARTATILWRWTIGDASRKGTDRPQQQTKRPPRTRTSGAEMPALSESRKRRGAGVRPPVLYGGSEIDRVALRQEEERARLMRRLRARLRFARIRRRLLLGRETAKSRMTGLGTVAPVVENERGEQGA